MSSILPANSVPLLVRVESGTCARPINRFCVLGTGLYVSVADPIRLPLRYRLALPTVPRYTTAMCDHSLRGWTSNHIESLPCGINFRWYGLIDVEVHSDVEVGIFRHEMNVFRKNSLSLL